MSGQDSSLTSSEALLPDSEPSLEQSADSASSSVSSGDLVPSFPQGDSSHPEGGYVYNYYQVVPETETPDYSAGSFDGLAFDSLLIVFIYAMVAGFGLTLVIGLMGWIINQVGHILQKGAN